MNLALTGDQEFISKITEIVRINLGDERFSGDELARKAGINKSLLSRRVQAITQKSVNQLIREIRLQRAKEMLLEGEFTASEISYKVGFGSATYFNKCFHDFFGYPPGEVKRMMGNGVNPRDSVPELNSTGTSTSNSVQPVLKKPIFRRIWFLASFIALAGIIAFLGNRLFYGKSGNNSGPLLKSEDKSIAVLPFKSINKDEGNLVFADGVTMNIRNNLMQVSQIRVISGVSSNLYRDSEKSAPEIAKALGVRFILEGSVQQMGDRFRVLLELIDAQMDQQIWTDKMEGEVSDMFVIQGDIAKKVAGKLQTVLSLKEEEQMVRVPTKNLSAYAFYQKGLYFMDRRDTDWVNKSREYFERAIEEDSGFAEAYAGMAIVYARTRNMSLLPANERYVKAKEFIKKALYLNKDLVEAHAILGEILHKEWNWEEAMKEYELAIRLNPNNASARASYSDLLLLLGKWEEARVQINLASALNPTSTSIFMSSASMFYREGKFTEALEECRKVVELNPDYYAVYWVYARIYRKMGEDSKVVDALFKALSIFDEDKIYASRVEEAYNESGITGLIKLMIELGLEAPESSILSLIEGYSILGEKEKALTLVEKAFENRNPGLSKIIYDPDIEIIANEPRFKAVFEKMGLTAYLRGAGSRN